MTSAPGSGRPDWPQSLGGGGLFTSAAQHRTSPCHDGHLRNDKQSTRPSLQLLVRIGIPRFRRLHSTGAGPAFLLLSLRSKRLSRARLGFAQNAAGRPRHGLSGSPKAESAKRLCRGQGSRQMVAAAVALGPCLVSSQRLPISDVLLLAKFRDAPHRWRWGSPGTEKVKNEKQGWDAL